MEQMHTVAVRKMAIGCFIINHDNLGFKKHYREQIFFSCAEDDQYQ